MNEKKKKLSVKRRPTEFQCMQPWKQPVQMSYKIVSRGENMSCNLIYYHEYGCGSRLMELGRIVV